MVVLGIVTRKAARFACVHIRYMPTPYVMPIHTVYDATNSITMNEYPTRSSLPSGVEGAKPPAVVGKGEHFRLGAGATSSELRTTDEQRVQRTLVERFVAITVSFI